jgi:hypothetical protein
VTTDDVNAELSYGWPQKLACTDLAIHHPYTLISDFKPDFTAQTNDDPDIVL